MDVIDLQTLNFVDAFLILIALLGAWSGWRRGLVVATLELFTLVASLVLAFLGYRYPAALLEAHAPWLGVWSSPLSFIATYVVAHLLLGAVASALARAVAVRIHRNVGNRVLGVVPGGANGLINATIVSLILLTAPILDSLSTMARESALAGRLSAPAEWLEAQLTPIFDPAIRRTLQAFTVPPESRSSVPLRFAVGNPKARPDLEERMLEMVNAERATQGLKPLKPDPELTDVARAHSRDMFGRGYFSHVAPDGKDLGGRIRQAGVSYLVAGENLALAPTLPGAHSGLMNSPGHRANILRPQFGRLGIGVMDGGRHGLMITQNFRN